jgi:hypothetical protein
MQLKVALEKEKKQLEAEYKRLGSFSKQRKHDIKARISEINTKLYSL